jgi:uracil-DNA glycosylase
MYITMTYHKSWNKLFESYIFDIDKLYSETKEEIYPKKEEIFRVFEIDINDINVVLVGQDPYHNPDQAHGVTTVDFLFIKSTVVTPLFTH